GDLLSDDPAGHLPQRAHLAVGTVDDVGVGTGDRAQRAVDDRLGAALVAATGGSDDRYPQGGEHSMGQNKFGHAPTVDGPWAGRWIGSTYERCAAAVGRDPATGDEDDPRRRELVRARQ